MTDRIKNKWITDMIQNTDLIQMDNSRIQNTDYKQMDPHICRISRYGFPSQFLVIVCYFNYNSCTTWSRTIIPSTLDIQTSGLLVLRPDILIIFFEIMKCKDFNKFDIWLSRWEFIKEKKVCTKPRHLPHQRPRKNKF